MLGFDWRKIQRKRCFHDQQYTTVSGRRGKKLEKVFNSYASDMTKVAEMVQGVTDSVIGLGLSMIAEEWEFYDTLLHDRKELRPGWRVVRRDEVSKLTSLGEVTYKRLTFIILRRGKDATC